MPPSAGDATRATKQKTQAAARTVVKDVKVAQRSLPWRAWNRYNNARGGVLAGGMAYAAFFSLLPALALGFTVLGLVLGNNTSVQGRVIKAVNDGVGTTVITTGSHQGIVDISTLTGSTELTVTGIVGLVGFLLTGLGWLDAMREGVRAMFGQPTLQGNFVKTKSRDLFVLATLGVVLLVSAVGGIVVSGATGWVLNLIGISSSSTPARVVVGIFSTLLLLAVDFAVFMAIFQLLSGVRVPRQDLTDAALVGGIGLGVLKLLSGLVLNSASHNKFLASAGLFVVLLVWLNLVSRLTLVAAAWGASVAIDRGHLAEAGTGFPLATDASGQEPVTADGAVGANGHRAAPAEPTTAAGTPSRPNAVPAARFRPVVSPRNADRISVAAGAILGAAGAVAARQAGNAVRAVVEAARHRSDGD
jgi:membrane protein